MQKCYNEKKKSKQMKTKQTLNQKKPSKQLKSIEEKVKLLSTAKSDLSRLVQLTKLHPSDSK